MKALVIAISFVLLCSSCGKSEKATQSTNATTQEDSMIGLSDSDLICKIDQGAAAIARSSCLREIPNDIYSRLFQGLERIQTRFGYFYPEVLSIQIMQSRFTFLTEDTRKCIISKLCKMENL